MYVASRSWGLWRSTLRYQLACIEHGKKISTEVIMGGGKDFNREHRTGAHFFFLTAAIYLFLSFKAKGEHW